MKLFLLILLFPSFLFAKTVKVMVIDSGLDDLTNVKLCYNGLQDLTNTNTLSTNGSHGNSITHIITDGLEKEDYCLYHFKVFTDSIYDRGEISWFVEAVKYAIANKVTIINYSVSGRFPSLVEESAIERALRAGIIFVTAAGNDGLNLNKKCSAFPACYSIHNSRFIVVANSNKKTANRGKVAKFIVNGDNITAGNVTMSGSSQSTALITRSIVMRLLKENK